MATSRMTSRTTRKRTKGKMRRRSLLRERR